MAALLYNKLFIILMFANHGIPMRNVSRIIRLYVDADMAQMRLTVTVDKMKWKIQFVTLAIVWAIISFVIITGSYFSLFRLVIHLKFTADATAIAIVCNLYGVELAKNFMIFIQNSLHMIFIFKANCFMYWLFTIMWQSLSHRIHNYSFFSFFLLFDLILDLLAIVVSSGLCLHSLWIMNSFESYWTVKIYFTFRIFAQRFSLI